MRNFFSLLARLDNARRLVADEMNRNAGSVALGEKEMNRYAMKVRSTWAQARAFAGPVDRVALASSEKRRSKDTCAWTILLFGGLGRVFPERRQTQREKTKSFYIREDRPT